MKNEKNTIKSPEEVSKLMEDLWLNHKAGNPLPKNNVFFVELPPPTPEEEELMRRNRENEIKG